MSWNGYRCYVPNEITKRLKNKKNTEKNNILEQQDIVTIVCRIPYAGAKRNTGKTLMKNLLRKRKRNVNKPLKLRNIYRTKKL